MTQALHQLTASMVNQLNRVETISNNLANANTTAFKEDSLAEGSFNKYLKQKEAVSKEPSVLSTLMNTIPKIDSTYMDSSVGALKLTGNNLDFALTQKDTYFKIDNNGKELYTRDGAFKVVDNMLVTQNGYNVLDANSNKITVDQNNGDFNSELGIYEAKFNTKDKVGKNNFFADKDTSVKQISNINNDKIVNKTLEVSNVNSIISMVSLIESQRKFEQSQKAITGIDEINKKVIDSIGNGR